MFRGFRGFRAYSFFLGFRASALGLRVSGGFFRCGGGDSCFFSFNGGGKLRAFKVARIVFEGVSVSELQLISVCSFEVWGLIKRA